MSLEVQRDQWQDIAQRAEWDVADRDREIAALGQRVEDLEERIRSAEAALEENRRFLARTSLRLGARVAHASDVVVGRLRRR
jgi:multidrug resistance efflux pump